jgi:hypothetical protein
MKVTERMVTEARGWVVGAVRRLALRGEGDQLKIDLVVAGIGFAMAEKMCAGKYTKTPTEANTIKILKVLDKHGISLAREIAS